MRARRSHAPWASATVKKIQEFHHHAETTANRARSTRLAKPLRYRLLTDPDGFPLIPGRYGRVEWSNERDLAVYCDRPRLFSQIWAIPGVPSAPDRRPGDAGNLPARGPRAGGGRDPCQAVGRAWPRTPRSGPGHRTNGYFPALGSRLRWRARASGRSRERTVGK